jgi:hypothetical protein
MFRLADRMVRLSVTVPDSTDPAVSRTPTGRERTRAQVAEQLQAEVRRRWRSLLLVTKVRAYPVGGPYWGSVVRYRLARQVSQIRHWQVSLGSYADAPDVHGTWFIDPPYQFYGSYYRYGSAGIDYPKLGAWCRERTGQVLVCEADGADWLPFRPLAQMNGTEGRQKTRPARMELVWTNTGGTP